MKCEICNNEYDGLKGLSIHLAKFHHLDDNYLKLYYDRYLKKEGEGICYFCKNNTKFIGFTKGYHNICESEECLGKTRATGTYEFLMYKYGLSKDDAIKMMNDRALDRGIKIKDGLDKKYIDNINFFKEKSHQTKEYWIKRGYTEKDAIEKAKEILDMIHNKTWKKRRKHPELYQDINTTQKGYWLKKGYTEEESKSKIKERQRTFTLETCIKKYGEVKGLEIYNIRQKRWSEIIGRKYKNGEFVKFRNEPYSYDEIELIESIMDRMNIKIDDVYYGTKQFFRYFKDLGKTFSYDFVYNHKIIEFNGNYWHCNPKKYNSNYFNKHLQMFANEIWEKDEMRIDAITKKGYDVLIIWEADYKQNKEKIIQECIDFIKK